MDQVRGDPLRDLRNDGVSCSVSFCKVGLIQSCAKPMIFNRSLPINHLIPSVGDSDEARTANADLAAGAAGE